MKRLKTIILLILMMSVSVFGFACAETVWGDLEARYANIPSLEYNGAEYRMRNRLTTILIAGIDKNSEVQTASYEFRNGGQADFLLLLVIDDNRDTITPLQINRDTIAEITVMNVLGEVTGSRTAQICLAHSFGDGGEQSCELLMSAISNYLQGVPIDHYMTMKLDGIPALNDALGGVEVTLKDDFSSLDPTMIPGTTLVLQGKQAEYFVRSRMGIGEQTNESRMVRQKEYLQAASEILLERLIASPNYINHLFDAVEAYSLTDMGRGRMLNYANLAAKYTIQPSVEIAGESMISEAGFMEFYPEEDSLMRAVIEVFFEKKD